MFTRHVHALTTSTQLSRATDCGDTTRCSSSFFFLCMLFSNGPHHPDVQDASPRLIRIHTGPVHHLVCKYYPSCALCWIFYETLLIFPPLIRVNTLANASFPNSARQPLAHSSVRALIFLSYVFPLCLLNFIPFLRRLYLSIYQPSRGIHNFSSISSRRVALNILL